MPGLVPGIRVFSESLPGKSWMAVAKTGDDAGDDAAKMRYPRAQKRRMALTRTSKWIAAAGAALLVFALADSLVPTTVQIRLGLHWLIEHFLAYFAVALLFCLAWQRPFIAAAMLMLAAGGIEALQGLTSDRVPDPATGFCGAAGALAGALTASLVTDLWQGRRRRPRGPFS